VITTAPSGSARGFFFGVTTLYKMTVGELKDLIETYPDDMEVRIAGSPNWPFEYTILAVVSSELFKADEDCKDGGDDENLVRHPSTWIAPRAPILYLVKG
jgi:hypothetical protein